MNDITNLLFVLAPLAVVAGGIYLLVKQMFDRDYKMKLIESKRMLQKEVLPLRLQAFERMTLFLERISPESLLVRIMDANMTVRDLHQQLTAAVRSEYEHNITQQIYIDPQTWALIKNAKEDILRLINSSAEDCNRDDKALELSRKIFERMLHEENVSMQKALSYLKAEAQQLF